MNGDKRFRIVFRFLTTFLFFFLLVAFVITACTLLFVTVLSEDLGIELTEENVSTAAKLTFLNVALISLLFTLIDLVRRRITVDRPVRQILDAMRRMTEGDFSVRISPLSRLLADEKFNEIIDCVNKTAKELSGLETLRTDFIANVSHEMKTPLAVMQNYGTLLSSPALSDAERIEYAQALTDATQRLSDMITNVLRLNRLENQQIYPKREKYDLGEQLCENLLQYESVWETRGIEIETEIEESVIICADAELLSLVWNNLFSNAFKFTDRGGKVSVKLTADGEYATVSVTDTGCGMTPEVGAHIFEKFYQGDTSRASAGNGLGLPLVKRVIDILEGEIGVESEEGHGTTFTVRIRREPNEPQKAR